MDIDGNLTGPSSSSAVPVNIPAERTSSFYSSPLVKNALDHLASTDPIDLCKEAKLEHCRATRVLRSCGLHVKHVLTSCGHSSLCAECAQRCEVCPICRVVIPKHGDRLQLRLYYECLEAGLISKDDSLFSEKKGEHPIVDVQRLYALFDVAAENNLIALICHYIKDVCMDDTAVSSDPALAFLLDEVVVKEWCKKSFQRIITDLHMIYTLPKEEIYNKLGLLRNRETLLSGISNVLETLEVSFAGTQSSELNDLHLIHENVLKVKQHLEAFLWCLRHQFLDRIPSCHSDISSWRTAVQSRKSAAVKRSWPTHLSNTAGFVDQPGSMLFIEDALSNLGIGHTDEDGAGELETSSFLQSFKSNIDGSPESYPFENLRSAIDILFLRGNPDLVVAKRAIFLYYLFDRHWTVPDEDWRSLVDDYAETFSITRLCVLESFIFYLLDDDTDMALEKACHLLPDISGPAVHPKIPQVLLERQRPEIALMVLCCSGHDGLSATLSTTLLEALIAVRVRVECGLLTQAFLYQRAHCSKVKEEQTKNKPSSKFVKTLEDGFCGWKDQIEKLVTEICLLCIRRNLVDVMIELPWNSEEEKFLRKCLLDNFVQDSSRTCGSLMVVYYLQRCRYHEAYQVEKMLKNAEQNIKTNNIDEVASMMKLVSQWRSGLVARSVELLPNVERERLKSGDSTGVSVRSPKAPFSPLMPSDKSAVVNSSLILPVDRSPDRTIASDFLLGTPGTMDRSMITSSGHCELASHLMESPSPVQRPDLFQMAGPPDPASIKVYKRRGRYNLGLGLTTDRDQRPVNDPLIGKENGVDLFPLKELHGPSLENDFSSVAFMHDRADMRIEQQSGSPFSSEAVRFTQRGGEDESQYVDYGLRWRSDGASDDEEEQVSGLAGNRSKVRTKTAKQGRRGRSGFRKGI